MFISSKELRSIFNTKMEMTDVKEAEKQRKMIAKRLEELKAEWLGNPVKFARYREEPFEFSIDMEKVIDNKVLAELRTSGWKLKRVDKTMLDEYSHLFEEIRKE